MKEGSDEQQPPEQRESDSDPPPDEDTVKLILEHIRGAPGEQLHDSEQLDTKMTAVFAGATVAVGLAGRLPDTESVTWFVYAAALFWAVALVCTVLHLLTKTFWRNLEAGVLWSDYKHRKPAALRNILVRDIARAYAKNRKTLDCKAVLFNIAVIATGLEGLSIVAALVLSR